jgi:hypothetical protein
MPGKGATDAVLSENEIIARVVSYHKMPNFLVADAIINLSTQSLLVSSFRFQSEQLNRRAVE